VVNDHDFKEIMGYSIQGDRLPSVETLKNILFKENQDIHNKIIQYLLEILSASLSADSWTSVAGITYFGVLLHFIKDIENYTILLGIVEKTESHTAEVLAKIVREILEKWKLLEDEYKIKSIPCELCFFHIEIL